MRWVLPSSAWASSSLTKASTVCPFPLSCFVSENFKRRVKRAVLARKMAFKILLRLSLVGGLEGRSDLTAECWSQGRAQCTKRRRYACPCARPKGRSLTCESRSRTSSSTVTDHRGWSRGTVWAILMSSSWCEQVGR